MSELKALARERGLRNYSRLRKAELIAFLHEAGAKVLQNNEHQVRSTGEAQAQRPPQSRAPSPPQMSTCEPQREPQTEARRQPEVGAPLTKRQLNRRRNKDSKLAKKFKNLEEEINNLKS